MTELECRICLEIIKGANIISVQAKVTDEKNVLQAIEELASLKGANDDPFPQFVCKKCFKILRSAVTFRRLIRSSYAEFTEKLTSTNINKEDSIINSAPVNFVNIGNQPEINIDFKSETDLTPIHENLLLENMKNEELKDEPKEDMLSNDGGSNFMEMDQDEVSYNNAELETKTPPIYIMRKKSENGYFSKKGNNITKEAKNASRVCALCGKTVKGKQNYNAHMKMHTNPIPPLVYVCPVCPKQFSQKKYLVVHRRSHTGEKPFRCDICNKNFSQFASFYVHKRRLHDKVVQGTCSYCGKKFVDKPELDVHIKMWHTGERPYLCEFCSATFVCNRTLQRHRRELHSEKKPCQKCGKMLGDYALKKHLVRHQVLEEGLKIIRKKYTCEYCKTVMNFTSRRRHLEKQHGIKLYGRGDDCKKIPIKEVSEST